MLSNYNKSISSSDSAEASLASGSLNSDVGEMLRQCRGKGSDVSEGDCTVQPEPSSGSSQTSFDLDTYISPGRPLTDRLQAVPLAEFYPHPKRPRPVSPIGQPGKAPFKLFLLIAFD